jgi:hypothetical protein
VNTSQIRVDVVDGAGPFRVTAPATHEVPAGPLVLTWDVAGTNQPPVHTELVNIWLSTDGGLTFTKSLAQAVANQGRATVLLPAVSTASARIKVESVGNIFFAISPADFAIVTTPAAAGRGGGG